MSHSRHGQNARRRPLPQDVSMARLRALQRALARRGMASDLDTRPAWPRLRAYGPVRCDPCRWLRRTGTIVLGP